MKPTHIFISILLFFLPFDLLAQDANPPKLRWGVGAGVNSLRVSSGNGGTFDIGLFGADTDISIERPGSSFGYQLHAYTKYRHSRVVEFMGAAGMTKAQANAEIRTESHGHIFGIPTHSIKLDDVTLKYLFLDVKGVARLHWKREGVAPEIANLFFDVGFVAQVPLVNDATYEYSREDVDDSFESGPLDAKMLSYYLGLGLRASDHIDVTLGFTFLGFESSNKAHEYNALLTQFSVNGYF